VRPVVRPVKPWKKLKNKEQKGLAQPHPQLKFVDMNFVKYYNYKIDFKLDRVVRCPCPGVSKF
jgi:hypothetical protein